MINRVVGSLGLPALAACTLLVGGCTPPGAAEPTPLHVSDANSGVSISEPPSRPREWWGSFGSRLMCSDEPVTLESAAASWKVKPLASTFFVRRVEDQQASPSTEIFFSWTGSAPQFAEPYSDGPMSGSFDPVKGARIDNECEKDPRAAVDLVLSVESGPRGSWLRDITLKYRTEDGSLKSLVLRHYENITCGSAIKDPNACSGPQ